MQDSDFNAIKSMEGLSTIGTSPKYQQQKKKKKEINNQAKRKIKETEEHPEDNDEIETSSDGTQHCIDFRA